VKKRMFTVLRNAILGFFLVLGVFALGTPLQELKSIQEKIGFAYEYSDPDLFQSAIQDLQSLLLNNPENIAVKSKGNILLGDAYFYQGLYLQAAESYGDALEFTEKGDGDYPYAVYSRVYAWYHAAAEASANTRGELLGNALLHLEELASFPDYQQDYYLLRAMLLRLQGDALGSISNLERVSDPELLGLAYYYKGMILFEQKNYPSAVLAFQNAEKNGQDKDMIAASLYQVVRAMMELKDYKQALEYSNLMISKYGSSRYRNEMFTLHVELLYRTGAYSSAKTYIDQILNSASSEKERMDGYSAMGWLAYKSGDKASAIDNWTKSMEIGLSQYPDVSFEMAKNVIHVLRENQDDTGMLAFLARVKGLFPSRATELDLESAKVYITLRKFNEAEVLLKRVLSSGLFYSECNYWLAQLYRERGDVDQALSYVLRSIQSGNASAIFRGFTLQGDLYFQKGSYDKAMESYNKALDAASESEKYSAILNLGIVALAAKQYQQAKGYFLQLKNDASSNLEYALDAAFYLADTYLAMSQPSQAASEYEWILARDTTGKYTQTAQIKRFEVLLEMGRDISSLLAELDRAISSATYPLQKKELQYLKGEVYLNSGDLYSAYETVRSLQDPALSETAASGILYIKGRYFAAQGNEAEVSRNYNQLLQEYPRAAKTPWALQDFALFYYNSGNFTQAKNYFFQLLTSYPDFQKADVAYYYIGLCYEKLGEVDKARKVFEDFLQKYPNSTRLADAQQKLNQY